MGNRRWYNYFYHKTGSMFRKNGPTQIPADYSGLVPNAMCPGCGKRVFLKIDQETGSESYCEDYERKVPHECKKREVK